MSSARELKDATVCIQSGTTNELNVADYFRAHGIRYKAVLDDSYEKSARALEAGQCDVLSSDQSQLYAQRLKLAKPDAIVMHPGPINRGVEIESAVADGAQSVILNQVTYGIAIRMAVLSMAMSGQNTQRQLEQEDAE